MDQADKHQPNKIFRGSIEEVFSHRNEIPPDAMIELRVFDKAPAPSRGKSRVNVPHKSKELRGYGMLAGVSSVDEFIHRKQEDIELEERSRR